MTKSKIAEAEREEGISPGLQTALWVGGALVGAAAIGGVAYWMTRDRGGAQDQVPPGSPMPPVEPPRPTPPTPTRTTPEGVRPPPSPPPLPVPATTPPPGPSVGGPIVDPVAGGPTLPPPAVDPGPGELEPDEPEATAEPDGGPDIGRPAPVLRARGLRVLVGERSIVVEDPDAWVAWAGPEIAGIDVESWPADEIMLNVWRRAFPVLDGALQEGGWTINGQPYEDVVARAAEFLSGMLADRYVVPVNFPGHKVFAKLMAGQTYTPLRLTVEPPNNPEVGWELRQRGNGFGTHHYLVRINKERNPALGQTIVNWAWWVWGPGVSRLDETNAMRKGGKAQKAEAIEAAEEFIDSYLVASAATS